MMTYIAPDLLREGLTAAGMQLPAPLVPLYSYVPVTRSHSTIYVSGQTPRQHGELVHTGRVGDQVTSAQAQHAARVAALNVLAAILAATDRPFRLLRLTGYVASASGFTDQATVIDAASTFFVETLGDAGRHARTALGVAELPGGAPVELDLIAELDND